MIQYLAQFFVEVGGVDFARQIALLVVQISVPGQKARSQKLLHLDGDIEGDGDNVVEEDQESEQVLYDAFGLMDKDKGTGQLQTGALPSL